MTIYACIEAILCYAWIMSSYYEFSVLEGLKQWFRNWFNSCVVLRADDNFWFVIIYLFSFKCLQSLREVNGLCSCAKPTIVWAYCIHSELFLNCQL